MVDLVLVQLKVAKQKVSEGDLRKIRNNLEAMLNAQQRKLILRRLVAILTPERYDASNWQPTLGINEHLKALFRKDNWEEVKKKRISEIPVFKGAPRELEDNIIYIEDNLGGVGLSPVPISKSNGDDGLAVYSEDTWKEQICKFVCPNRWVFRILSNILLAILLLYAVASYRACQLRRVYEKYFWYFLVYVMATLASWSLMWLCDPSWQESLPYMFMLFVLGAIAYGIVTYQQRMKRGQAP